MYVYIHVCKYTHIRPCNSNGYDDIIGLFCKRALYKRRYSAEETYNLNQYTALARECIHGGGFDL